MCMCVCMQGAMCEYMCVPCLKPSAAAMDGLEEACCWYQAGALSAAPDMEKEKEKNGMLLMAYAWLPLLKPGMCSSLIALGNKGLGCGRQEGKYCIASQWELALLLSDSNTKGWKPRQGEQWSQAAGCHRCWHEHFSRQRDLQQLFH